MNYANFPLDKRMPLPNSDAGNGEDFIDIERLLGMAARQAKVVAVCAVIGLFLGVLYLQTTPPKYHVGLERADRRGLEQDRRRHLGGVDDHADRFRHSEPDRNSDLGAAGAPWSSTS